MQLAILVPSTDTWMTDFALSVLALQQMLSYHPIGEDFKMNLLNERGSLIAHQREQIAQHALESGATHLLWLDSDMKFPPDIVHKLWAHGQPIVGCNYTKRTIPAMPNTKDVDGKLIATNKQSTGVVEVGSMGFGCVLMEREVFETIPRPWFDTVWFENSKGELQMMGEDVYFCRKARHHNMPILLDHDASQGIGHVGSFEYTNELTEATWEEVDYEPLKQGMMSEVQSA